MNSKGRVRAARTVACAAESCSPTSCMSHLIVETCFVEAGRESRFSFFLCFFLFRDFFFGGTGSFDTASGR